jgi:nucleoside 2-deoxyribosyltransferase
MIVVGGYYLEQCVRPSEFEGFGSGGRAAMAIAASGEAVKWHYYCPLEKQNSVFSSLAHENIEHHPHASDTLVHFRYFHPLSSPIFSPSDLTQHPTFKVEGEIILRFGFMEGDARVVGNRVVYDPQSPHDPVGFSKNGSKAEELAVVLNSHEVQELGGSDVEIDAVKKIAADEGANIIVVKAATEGCRVYQSETLLGVVPPYASERVYKIGSGDVFSAGFSYHWGVLGKGALESADVASRCTSLYCETRYPSTVVDGALKSRKPIKKKNDGSIYIAGPFFTVGELWVVEEAWRVLTELGVPVFSPYHDVGVGPSDHVAAADLNALKKSSVVLAFIDGCDPGTIFEIGFARSKDIPVVALAENPKHGDMTMLEGSGCLLTDDFSTAIYRAVWESQR